MNTKTANKFAQSKVRERRRSNDHVTTRNQTNRETNQKTSVIYSNGKPSPSRSSEGYEATKYTIGA